MHFDFARTKARLSESSAAEGDPLELLAPLKQRLEIGEIDGAAFVAEGISILGYRGSAEEFRSIWEDIFTPNAAMWETITTARDRYRLVLLSNTSEIHKQSLFRDFEIFESFEDGVYSYSSRCAKPDPEFYRTAIETLGLRPAETLYVDDRPENVDAGRRAGFLSVYYDPQQHERFLREARAHGFAL
ncbi:MAG: HAD-IA family hydrolase [Candidatus Binatia bacterium]|nr:HAD-IA family hydrolase [Candidatus Binatia bacterium]